MGKLSETSQFDLVPVDMGAGEGPNGLLDIQHVAQPETEISSRLHLSLIMSCEALSGNASLSVAKHNHNSKLSSLYAPELQNERREAKLMEFIFSCDGPARYKRTFNRHHSLMLIAQWQNAVTRKILVGTYSFPDIMWFSSTEACDGTCSAYDKQVARGNVGMHWSNLTLPLVVLMSYLLLISKIVCAQRLFFYGYGKANS